MYQMKLGKVVTTIPTIGFNVETIECKGWKFTSWDMGGMYAAKALIVELSYEMA